MIKTPLPDDVFARWLKQQDGKKVEKKFGRKASEVSAMEVVGREIHKSPAIIFKAQVSSKNVKIKDKNKPKTYKDIQKEKFYRFGSTVESDNWKDDEAVLMLDKLKEEKCSSCKGSGLQTCKKCNGAGKYTCENCKKDKKLRCSNCKGDGKMEIELTVYNEQNKKDNVKRKINCPECHGKTKIVCPDCGDTKVTGCGKCNGTGGKSCKNCKGTGIEFYAPLAPVPFKSGSEVHWHWNESIEKQMNKSDMMKNTELLELLTKSKVQAIRINKLKELDQKHLEDKLGFWDKETSSQIKDAKKDFEKMEKSKGAKPLMPLEIYPLQKIDIDTYENKKFSIYSIGSDQGYVVFDLGF